MERIKNKLNQLSKLSDPNTFITEEPIDGIGYLWIDKDTNAFFQNCWISEYDDAIIQLVYYCGRNWTNYIFDLFYSEFKHKEIDYYINYFIGKSSKNIKKYFQVNRSEIFNPRFNKYPKTWKSVFKELPPSIESVSQRFYFDLSSFLFSRAKKLINECKLDILNRKRKSKVTGEIFNDKDTGRSISFYNRSILEWDLQNYKIEISQYEFDSFRRIGSDEDVKSSIGNLRKLIEFLEFIPQKNFGIYDFYRNIPMEKFVEFVKFSSETFYPIRYCSVYGDWLKAVIATGYLGEREVLKTIYGYKVVAKDGHICNSLAEKIIDDFLYNKGIKHEKEPAYPKCVRNMMKSKVRADWKVGDNYIEYFGLQTKRDYARKTASKILSCEYNGINLIALYAGDEYHLDEVLKSLCKC